MKKQEMNYSYFVYGLIIQSPLPLPELVACDRMADVVIRLDTLNPSLAKPLQRGTDFRVTSEGIFLFWKNEGTFLIRDGKEIILDPAPEVDERVLRLIILGPALAILLYQRGQLALHAATIEVAERAVAIMGAPGCGKSALAAMLHRRGHRIMADDLTAIQNNGTDVPVAIPGFPQLKLWPEIIAALGENPEALACIEPGTEKRSLILSKFSNKPAPLKKIYLLNREQTNSILSLSPQDALVEVIRHSYRAPLVKWIGVQRHLYQCARLVNSVPISRLNISISPHSLADAARIVEDDLTA